jgi:hypothetical protein
LTRGKIELTCEWSREKSQSLKNEGKITITLENMGKNTNLMYDFCGYFSLYPSFWHSLTSRTFSKNPFGRRKDSVGGVAGILNGASAN